MQIMQCIELDMTGERWVDEETERLANTLLSSPKTSYALYENSQRQIEIWNTIKWNYQQGMVILWLSLLLNNIPPLDTRVKDLGLKLLKEITKHYYWWWNHTSILYHTHRVRLIWFLLLFLTSKRIRKRIVTISVWEAHS